MNASSSWRLCFRVRRSLLRNGVQFSFELSQLPPAIPGGLGLMTRRRGGQSHARASRTRLEEARGLGQRADGTAP